MATTVLKYLLVWTELIQQRLGKMQQSGVKPHTPFSQGIKIYLFLNLSFKGSVWLVHRVQSRYEPRKMTSGASRFAKLPPRQSKSSPCLTLCLQASATLTPRPAFLFPKTNNWLIHPAKSLCNKHLYIKLQWKKKEVLISNKVTFKIFWSFWHFSKWKAFGNVNICYWK